MPSGDVKEAQHYLSGADGRSSRDWCTAWVRQWLDRDLGRHRRRQSRDRRRVAHTELQGVAYILDGIEDDADKSLADLLAEGGRSASSDRSVMSATRTGGLTSLTLLWMRDHGGVSFTLVNAGNNRGSSEVAEPEQRRPQGRGGDPVVDPEPGIRVSKIGEALFGVRTYLAARSADTQPR